jgi:MtaA/CmuA family methyltransferase
MTEIYNDSRDTVRAALLGLPNPRCATGPLAVHYCAQFAGISIREYTLNAEKLAESVIRYYERFRPDAVWLSADTWVSAEAMGAAVRFPGENQPLGGTGEPCIRTAADIERISPTDPSTRGRQPLMLEALHRIKTAIGQDAYIVACFDQYPFSLACALMGMESIMVKLIEDPPLVEAVMERALEQGLAYAHALADAGADILSGGDSPAGLMGPAFYESMALPFEQRLIAEFKARHTAPVSLHICGNAGPILTGMASAGADILELDHLTDLAQACDVLDPATVIWGNLDPVAVLAQGSIDAVRQAVLAMLETMRARGRRFVLSSGCTLAMDTPPENIDALLETAREARATSPATPIISKT